MELETAASGHGCWLFGGFKRHCVKLISLNYDMRWVNPNSRNHDSHFI